MSPAQKKIKAWREDPVLFVREVFKAEPDAWQAEVLRAFPKNNRLAMKSSKGVGKSTILAWCGWNFLATRPHPKMVATSISADNLSDGLWAEMSHWQSKSEFLKTQFVWTKTRIFAKDYPETWFLSARTWPKSADSSQQADTLAGIHSDYVLFILDECGGIPDGVMAAAEAGLSTGTETKILMAGNPTSLSGPLYRAATTERNLWHLTEITSDPDDPKRSPRVSIQWAKEQIEKYGAMNPWVLVNVFGKFPPSSINSLLGIEEVTAAMGKHLREDQYNFAQKRLGVDCARFGDDRTVIFPRQGLAAFKPTEMRNARSNEIAARVQLIKSEFESEIEFIDDTGGFGSGVIDSLIQAGHSPQSVQFAGRAIDSRYHNKRAEIWFLMSEWVKRGGALPNIPELARELTTPTYTFQNGKLLIEPKDQIKERLGFSPDYADALCFVGSTLIGTPFGDRRIDSLRVNQSVSTPVGNRKILKVWKSQTKSLTTVQFSNGTSLRGKAEHEIFTWNRGWVKLDALTSTDVLEHHSLCRRLLWKFLSFLFIRALNIGFKQAVDIIKRTHMDSPKDFFIVEFGSMRMVLFLQNMSFIIKTMIGRTMLFPTLSALKEGFINRVILNKNLSVQSTKLKTRAIFRRLETQPRIGTAVQRGVSGIPSTRSRYGKQKRQKNKSALFVEKNFKLISKLEKALDFAQSVVLKKKPINDIRRPIEFALNAVKNLFATNISRPRVVVISVQTAAVEEENVYNLTLESDNIYYANGILVANCLTFSLPEMPSSFGANAYRKTAKAASDWDPLESVS